MWQRIRCWLGRHPRVYMDYSFITYTLRCRDCYRALHQWPAEYFDYPPEGR